MKSDFSLNIEEKIFLLKLARTTLENACSGKSYPHQPFFSDKLKIKSGVFVTLHYRKELRGCIGYVQGVSPLQNAVQEMALSAAFTDPRFEPVVADELGDLEIEISVLSPLEAITDVEKIIPGKHGLVIEQDMNRGLLLPQVATEQNWDRENFLRHTCHKAGLSFNAWKEPGTRIYIFHAEIFSEIEFLHET